MSRGGGRFREPLAHSAEGWVWGLGLAANVCICQMCLVFLPIYLSGESQFSRISCTVKPSLSDRRPKINTPGRLERQLQKWSPAWHLLLFVCSMGLVGRFLFLRICPLPFTLTYFSMPLVKQVHMTFKPLYTLARFRPPSGSLLPIWLDKVKYLSQSLLNYLVPKLS